MRLTRLALAALFAVAPPFTDLARAGAPPIPAPAAATTFRSGPILSCVGDSECVQGQVSNPPTSLYYSTGASFQVGTNANSIIGWLGVASGGGFVIDFVNQSYPGNWGGLYYIRILTRGSGCPASTPISVTVSTPTGTPANTAAALSFTTDASGNTPVLGTTIFEPNATAQGSGYIANPTFSISPSCSTPPTFGYALTGTGSYGVNGDVTANWVQRIQSEVCANPPDWAINIIGTNDIDQAVPEAAINANTISGLAAEQACGIRTILVGVMPRVIGIGGWTQAMDKERLRINAFRRNIALASQTGQIVSTSGLPTIGGLISPVIFVDVDHLWSDPSQTGATAGNPIFNDTIDGLHQSSIGAFYEALSIWNQVKTFFPQGGPSVPNSQNDAYDPTYNPAGNLLGATDGLFLGTSGTVTAPCTTSSALATHWNLLESGNASMSCIATLETARMDGLLGQRQVVTISDAGGTTSDKVTLAYYVNFTSSLTAGDQIFFEGDLDLSNLNQVKDVGCQISETNAITQVADSTFSGNVDGYTFSPNFNSATIAKLNEAKSLPDFGLTAPGSFRMHFRTPPLTVQAGDTGWITQCVVYLNGSTGTATATVKAGNFATRKINAS
jgi:hypothetical protein